MKKSKIKTLQGLQNLLLFTNQRIKGLPAHEYEGKIKWLK
jgi:hypothetical protein